MRVTLLVRMCALLAVLGLLGTIASPASAGKPEKIVINESFPEEVCGVPVQTTVTGHVILHIQDYIIQADDPETQNDFWIGVIQEHVDVTFTNAAGVTLTIQVRATTQEGSLEDIGGGFWVYTYAVNGLPLKLRSGNEILIMDRGHIVEQIVFYFGDLSTLDDDEFISHEVLSISGPHPQAESDFTLFCEVVNDILG
jgi:hypothetical protein